MTSRAEITQWDGAVETAADALEAEGWLRGVEGCRATQATAQVTESIATTAAIEDKTA